MGFRTMRRFESLKKVEKFAITQRRVLCRDATVEIDPKRIARGINDKIKRETVFYIFYAAPSRAFRKRFADRYSREF